MKQVFFRSLIVFSLFLSLYPAVPGTFYITYYSPDNDFPVLSTIYPLSLYSTHIRETHIKTFTRPYTVFTGSVLSPDISAISQLESGSDSPVLHVFFERSENKLRAKSGWVQSTRTNNDKVYYIIAGSSTTGPELLHEAMHTYFNLSDEYGSEPYIPPHCRDRYYRNVSYNPVESAWEAIGIRAGVPSGSFEGGMGYARGIYRPYLSCLMRSLDAKLCPVCLFYVIQDMNALTEKEISFDNECRMWYTPQ